MFNEIEMRQCYRFLNHLNSTEIRIIDPKKILNPQSFFVYTETEFVNKCKEYNGKYNLYAGINERTDKGTTKKDVISVKTIVIDIDAIKEKGFEQSAANEKEIKQAEKICDNILEDIKKSKQILPIKLHSGNGFQLWFAIPNEVISDYNKDVIENKIQLFQEKIIETYDTNHSIDKIGDLPRIIKIWGTLNIKGDNTKERPYRIAKVIGNYERKENRKLKELIWSLDKNKEKEYDTYDAEDIDKFNVEDLPPCINYLLNHYENQSGNYWFRIVQLFSSFFMGIGLKKNKTLDLILNWNKKQPYHEEGEEKEIDRIVSRIYNNKINMCNCLKIKKENGGFPYFGVSELKICKPDNLCNRCINPIIRYKRIVQEEEGLDKAIKVFSDKRDLAKQFLKIQPIHYDSSKIWWLWNSKKFRWQIIDETDLLNKISLSSNVDTIKHTEKTEILEALKQMSRLNKPKKAKKNWIQFKDTIVDIETDEKFKATSEYFVTNPIPWEIKKTEETLILDRIFEEWVGKDYVQTLYEIIAYCLLPDYPIHRIFCFNGEGLNGKSSYLELVSKFIGRENVTSTELDVLTDSRFEITRLHKKLICQMGETDFSEMKKTAILKKLTGRDLIGFEYKNKDPFEDYNYAKILISTNNLPTTSDKTVGFYRRWLIIDFPNKFSEKKDILNDIPKEEYENLTLKSIDVLKELLNKREFHKEGSIEERKKKYEEKSNPFDKFWLENIEEDVDYNIFKYEFKQRLEEWCKSNRFRILTDVFISKRMKEKEINTEKVPVDWYNNEGEKKRYNAWVGIKWK